MGVQLDPRALERPQVDQLAVVIRLETRAIRRTFFEARERVARWEPAAVPGRWI
jgi:hypothetical protein